MPDDRFGWIAPFHLHDRYRHLAASGPPLVDSKYCHLAVNHGSRETRRTVEEDA
jgi:hypothetical protein